MTIGVVRPPSQRYRNERDTAEPDAWKGRGFPEVKERLGFVRATAQEGETAALREQFSKAFSEDPEGAVNYLRQQVFGGSSPQAAAEVLLPYTVKASYAQKNLVCPALLELATPDDLINAAFAGYGRNADTRLLQSAASLMEHYDAKVAWPALDRLVRSGRPECRYFVGTIIHWPGVPEEQKREAMTALAGHPNAGTRQELLDETDRVSASDAVLVWRLLAHDPDSNIRTVAGERLAELEP